MTTVLLVDLPDSLRSVAQEAVRLAFGNAAVIELPSAAQVVGRTAANQELVVLAEPSPRDLAVISAAADEATLQRWPIVVIGEEWAEEWAEVAPPDCDARLLAAVLKCAQGKHRLRRDYARARGDLWTMGRRLTHDMRTPIGCIVTASDALQEILANDTTGNDTLVKSIADSAAEMARLVERVSVVARASADTVPRERVDMALVFALARDRLQAAAETAGAHITEPDDWPEVRGVSNWLESVWRDLLANAIEHAGANPRIDIGWERRETDAVFWVSDHGVGVPSNQRDRLFQPFHLLHQLNSAHGLGLAIVRRLVELQGGQVGYEPLATGGSCFRFSMPLAESRHALPAAIAAREASGDAGGGDSDSQRTIRGTATR